MRRPPIPINLTFLRGNTIYSAKYDSGKRRDYAKRGRINLFWMFLAPTDEAHNRKVRIKRPIPPSAHPR